MENSSKNNQHFIQTIEYLITLLHTAWERSGVPVAEAEVTFEEAFSIYERIALLISDTQYTWEADEDMTFEQSMELSGKHYVFLRILRKMLDSEERISQKGTDHSFSFPLDQEEAAVFRNLV